MARSSELRVTISGDARQLNRALKGAGRNLEQFGRQTSLHGRLSSRGFSGIAVAARGATAGVGALAAAGGYFVKQYEESAKVGRQTGVVLKSTGGAANVTATQVTALANAISRKTGIDDEAIQSGENLLLTFTNIRNETGKGNAIFSQATQSITDLSVALGQDMKSSAIQVGKALNDPIRGVTALRRVGVSFTAQQQAQIKTLVETGHQMDAQRLILRELNKEFGGSARAAATPFDKMKVSLGNLAETIGGALAPTVRRAEVAITKFVNQMMDGTGAGGRFVDKMKDIAQALAPMIRALGRVAKFFGDHPKLIAVAIGAWGVYKATAVAAALRTRLAILGVFKKGPLVAGAAEAGAASGSRFAGRFSTLLKGFGWAAIGWEIANALGLDKAIQSIAQRIRNNLHNLFSGDFYVDPDAVPNDQGTLAVPKPTNRHPIGPRSTSKKKSPRSAPRAVAGAASVTTRMASTSPMARAASSSLGIRQLEELWISAGGDPRVANMMARIAIRESGGNPGATNLVGRDHSIGLWQINQLAHHGRYGSDRQLMNPRTNAKAAVALYRAAGGPTPWSTYNPAIDRKYIGAGARRAAQPQVKRGTSLMAAGIIAKKFGLRVSSGYRSPERNAAVGGVPNSYHTRGSASNPGAVDLLGSTSQMSKALAWARTHVSPLAEAMIHNAGSGLHLHLAFSSSTVTVKLDAGDAGSSGGFAAARPPTQAEINQRNFQGVSNRLDMIGMRVTAGELTSGEAGRAKLGVIGRALRGGFGSLSGRDRLSLKGSRVEARGDVQGERRTNRQNQKARGNAALHSAYNYYRRNMDLFEEKEAAGEFTAEQALMWKRALIDNALNRKGRFALFFPLTAHERRLVLADLRALDGDAADPTSFAGTAFDDAALTMAQVNTPNDNTDDLGVLTGRLQIATAAYNAAVASNDRGGIAKWGGIVNSLRSDIDSAQGSGGQADLAAALKELTDQIKAQNNFAAQVTSVSLGQAWRALADIVSGQIVGIGYQGRSSTAGAGSVARY